MKAALHDAALKSDRNLICLHRDTLDIDVDRFREALTRIRSHGHTVRQGCIACHPNLLEAVGLYRADFLTGFALRDSPEFDDWQLLQAEALRRDLAGALEGIVSALSTSNQFEEAIKYARRWLTLDILHESVHRTLMELYSRAGQRSLAIRQYRECVRILDEELSVAPTEETTRLYQAIKEYKQSLMTAPEPATPVPQKLRTISPAKEMVS